MPLGRVIRLLNLLLTSSVISSHLLIFPLFMSP